jgi:hypothetical protein
MATKLNPLTYKNFWEEAASLEFGLLVELESEADKPLFVNALYECRKMMGGFENMMISQPHPANTVFIHKKEIGEMP